MNRLLTSIVLVSLISFPIAHGFAHADMHSHIDESHFLNLNDHSHFEHSHHTVDSNHDHQENLHKHLDNLFLRLSRQREFEYEIFTPQLYLIEKAFLYAYYFDGFRKPQEHIQTSYYSNQPFLSNNQPLLI